MADIETVAMALSDPIRLRILDLVASGRTGECCSPKSAAEPDGVCACDVGPTLGLAPSKLAYHMRILREADLLSERRVAKWVYYRLNDVALTAFTDGLRQRYLATTPATVECCEPA